MSAETAPLKQLQDKGLLCTEAAKLGFSARDLRGAGYSVPAVVRAVPDVTALYAASIECATRPLGKSCSCRVVKRGATQVWIRTLMVRTELSGAHFFQPENIRLYHCAFRAQARRHRECMATWIPV